MGCRHIDCFETRNETQSIQNDFEKVLLVACTLTLQKIFEKHVKIDAGP